MDPLQSTVQHNTLKVVSQNVKGLNIPEKRSQILNMMSKLKADVIFLQETHFRTDNTPKLASHKYPISFHATNPLTKTKGVSILLSKNLPWQLIDSLIDPEGRYVFLKGTIHNRMVTLANIYSPNTAQVCFFRSIAAILAGFQAGTTILGGDFNVTLQPILDSSSGSSTLPYRALRQVKMQLQELLLHDTWRTLHPNGKDYSFFSAPHSRYSRLDYLFLSQKDLPFLKSATIEPLLISDHHPITLSLSFPERNLVTKIWRLDPSLLTSEIDTNHIRTSLNNYFRENDNSDTTPLSLWEAHKCVIRGEFLTLQANRKKTQQITLQELTNKIKRLEILHKQSQSQDT